MTLRPNTNKCNQMEPSGISPNFSYPNWTKVTNSNQNLRKEWDCPIFTPPPRPLSQGGPLLAIVIIWTLRLSLLAKSVSLYLSVYIKCLCSVMYIYVCVSVHMCAWGMQMCAQIYRVGTNISTWPVRVGCLNNCSRLPGCIRNVSLPLTCSALPGLIFRSSPQSMFPLVGLRGRIKQQQQQQPDK